MMVISETLLRGTFRESQQSWAVVIKVQLWKWNIKHTIIQLITQKEYLKKSVLAMVLTKQSDAASLQHLKIECDFFLLFCYILAITGTVLIKIFSNLFFLRNPTMQGKHHLPSERSTCKILLT